MKTKIAVIICLLLPFLFGCGSEQPAHDEGKFRVMCTTGIVADLVRMVGGSSVEVGALMGPGVDPHLYKATSGDLAKLREADLVVYNGLHLEGKLSDVLSGLADRQAVIALADGIPKDALLVVDDHSGVNDPHIWFDVSLWSQAAAFVGETLSSHLPGQEDSIRLRVAAVQDSLLDLHDWVMKKVQEIPDSQRVMITAHDAFGYFGRAYNIEVRGLQGISTVAEFGVGDLAALVDFISTRKINAVFLEHSVSRQALEAVVEGCAKRGHTVSIGGTLYSDALGDIESGASTYPAMIRSNVNTIIDALKPHSHE